MYSFYLMARIRIPQIVVCLFSFPSFYSCLTCNSCTCHSALKLVSTVSLLFFSLCSFLSSLSMGLFDRVWIYSLTSRASWLTAAQCSYAFCLCLQRGSSSLYDMSHMVEGVLIALRTNSPPCGFSRMERGKSLPPYDRESDRKD